MKKKMRTIQPAHESDRITVEAAMEGWLKIQGGERTWYVAGARSGAGKASATPRVEKAAPTRAKVAADHDKRSPEP